MTEEVVEQAVTAPEKPVEGQPAEPVRDYEAEARAGGWAPETEWKGDKRPSKFLSAQEFVERGEEITPFLRKENKRLHERLDRVTRDFEGRISRLSKVAETTQERLVADYEERLSAIKTSQEKAVEAGDKDEFKRLERQRGELEARRPEEIVVEDTKPDIDGDFKKNNTWYGVDDDMTAIAVGYSQKLAAKDNTISVAENLRQTEQYMRQKYPALYGQAPKPAANGHAAVDGGGSFPSSGNKPDPLSRLPNEARHQAKLDMQKYPKIYPTPESWIKTYEGK